MMTGAEVLRAVTNLHHRDLSAWVEAQWIRPEWRDGEQVFAEVDVARIRLISEIHHGLGIERESISVVLSLLDQLYTARRQLSALEQALASQPESVRAQVQRQYGKIIAGEN